MSLPGGVVALPCLVGPVQRGGCAADWLVGIKRVPPPPPSRHHRYIFEEKEQKEKGKKEKSQVRWARCARCAHARCC